MKPRHLAPFLLVIAGLLAWHNSFHGPFIFDDRRSIIENPHIVHLWPIWDALSPNANSYERPIVNFSLALNYALGGLAVWGYHAFNLAVHVLAALTLYGIVRRTLLRPGLPERFGTSGEWLALVVAVIWAVHPLQTEAVTYISQRCESLMGWFYLLTLYCFIRGVESTKVHWWYVLSATACLLGMGTKEVMVSAPLMVLLYDRAFVSRSFREAWTGHRRLYLGLASSWLLLGYLMAALHHPGIGYGLECTWWGYALTECRAVVQYLRLALWPHPLIFDYGFYVPTAFLAAAPYALFLAVLAAGVLFELKRRPAIGFVGAWFFVILAPTSSVVPVAGSPMAEHRMYLPLAAVVTVGVVGAFEIGKRLFNSKQGVVLGCVAGGSVVALLTFLTIQRNRDYNSLLAIWQDTATKRPDNARAHSNLGTVLLQAGNVQESISQYEQALRIKPDYAEARFGLGSALLQEGKVQEAIAQCEEALRIKPDFVQAHYDLGLALVQQGRLQEAIGHYEEALRIKPDYDKAHNSLGMALVQQGRLPEAIVHYEQALQINPDSAEARFNLGAAFEQVGKPREAMQQYEEVLRIRSDHIEAQNNLAWLLATRAPADGGNPSQSLALAQRACELSGNRLAPYLDTLAAAYAATGQFSNAVATAQQAVDLARVARQPQVAREIQARLDSYRSGKAYHPAPNAASSPLQSN